MIKLLRTCIILLLAVFILLSGCARDTKHFEEQEKKPAVEDKAQSKVEEETESGNENLSKDIEEHQNTSPVETIPQNEDTPGNQEELPIDLEKVKPNEAGKIMVVMFHNFIESYRSGDKEYTTTFSDFEKLLHTLYDSGYRLISLSDYLNNNITTPAGYIPIIFTFDDGTPGQFSLVEENGELLANRKSAVGILEEFYKAYPDFGLEGTFYVNLGLGTFQGKGTMEERLRYLIGRGFEIGNHTLSHVDLSEVKSAEEIQQEIGGNQKKMYELVPGYKMNSFSLPFGIPSKELQKYIVTGEYEGIKYHNKAIMEVGWDPALSPVSNKFNPLSIHRVRASGIEPVDADLAWWLKNLSRDEQYVSDGNPNTITVPKSKTDSVDKDRLNGKQFIVY
jgi:hypothetical protein